MQRTVILPSPERLPLPPHETASLVCLLDRLHPIHDLLLKRWFQRRRRVAGRRLTGAASRRPFAGVAVEAD